MCKNSQVYYTRQIFEFFYHRCFKIHIYGLKTEFQHLSIHFWNNFSYQLCRMKLTIHCLILTKVNTIQISMLLVKVPHPL